MHDYTIRPATSADLPRLFSLDQIIFGSYGGDEDPAIIAARLSVYPIGCAILQYNDGSVVGYLTTEKWGELRDPVLNEDPATSHDPEGKILNITTLAIAPDYQSQGLGRLLLAHAESLAIAEGCSDVILETARAQRFYERHGYSLVGEREQQGVILFVMRRTF